MLLYLTETAATVASVGSTKAVLATLPGAESKPRPLLLSKSDAFHRTIEPIRALDAVEVSVEVKVECEEELQRISKAGGRVLRVSTSQGEKVGPYRVWKSTVSLPGLACSRSLCDKMASDLGVIPTPAIRQFQLFPQSDLFFIMASDGLW